MKVQQGNFVNDWMAAETVDDLKWRLNKFSDTFFRNLTHVNVKKLYTEYCSIRSEEGETQIIGPLVKMWDKQATPELRLQMGYDSGTSDFSFNLFDVDGNQTVTLSSTGQFLLTGKPLISMYDATPTLRLKMGYDSGTSTWGFNMYDTSGNSTVSLSATGQLQLVGKPLISMYDNQAVPVLRLKMGYDSGTSTWGFNMYDSLGSGTVSLSATGQFQLGGKPLLSMYDNQAVPVLRLKMGYDSPNWVFEMYNAAGTKTIGVDGSGNGTIDSGTITGGTIRTAASGSDRIELSSGMFRGITASNKITGMYFDIGTVAGTGIADIYFYHNDTQLARFYDGITYWALQPVGSASLILGVTGLNTSIEGAVQYSGADSVNGLDTDTHTQGSHNHGIPDGTVLMVDGGGTVTFVQSGGFSHNHLVQKA